MTDSQEWLIGCGRRGRGDLWLLLSPQRGPSLIVVAVRGQGELCHQLVVVVVVQHGRLDLPERQTRSGRERGNEGGIVRIFRWQRTWRARIAGA